MNYAFKMVAILLAPTLMILSSVNILMASDDIILNCSMKNFDGSKISNTRFIPAKYILHLTSKITNITSASSGSFKNYKIEVTKTTPDRIYFEYLATGYKEKFIRSPHWTNPYNFRPWKHIYFKKTKKINVSIMYFKSMEEYWGDCTVEKLNKDILVASKDLENTKVKSVLKLKRNETKETTRRLAEVLAKKEAKEERQKRIELEIKMAVLEKKQKEQ